MSNYNGKLEKDIREQMKLSIQVALQEVLQMPLHVKVLSSEVTHETLVPEGDLFNLRFRVQAHPRKPEEKKPYVPTN